jgi:hypothetical protein
MVAARGHQRQRAHAVALERAPALAVDGLEPLGHGLRIAIGLPGRRRVDVVDVQQQQRPAPVGERTTHVGRLLEQSRQLLRRPLDRGAVGLLQAPDAAVTRDPERAAAVLGDALPDLP